MRADFAGFTVEKYLEGREDDTHKEMRVWLEEMRCHSHSRPCDVHTDTHTPSRTPQAQGGTQEAAAARTCCSDSSPNSSRSSPSASCCSTSASATATATNSTTTCASATTSTGLSSVRVFDPLNARADMRQLVARFLEKEAAHRRRGAGAGDEQLKQQTQAQTTSASAVHAADMDDEDDEERPSSYASPVCYAHEFPEYFGLPAKAKAKAKVETPQSCCVRPSSGEGQQQPQPMETDVDSARETNTSSCCAGGCPSGDSAVLYHTRSPSALGSRGWLERVAAHVPEEDAWHLQTEALVDRYLTVFVRSSSFLNKMVHALYFVRV